MKIKETLCSINEEIGSALASLNETQLDELERQIANADRVFVAGAGRSLMMIRALAMRLMHIGYQSYVVGETVTPSIKKDDLLIIASGSGETGTLKVMGDKCKALGAKLALITTKPESYLGKKADVLVCVDAATTKADSDKRSIQPGANTFEQCVLLIGDAIIIDLTSQMELDEINRNLMDKHANLE